MLCWSCMGRKVPELAAPLSSWSGEEVISPGFML